MIEENDLPRGWVQTTLGEICSKPQYGWTTKANPKSGSVRLLRTTDISDGFINWETVPYCTEVPENLEAYLLEENDIVISRAGSVGVSYLLSHIPYEVVFASYLIRFRSLEGIDPKYMAYYLQTPTYWDSIYEQSSGIALANVNARKLEAIEIPLAPTAEQQRIVAAIEQQFTRLDAGVAALQRARTELKRYRAAVLKAAVEGKLTEAWRAEHPTTEPASMLLERILKERRTKWEADLRAKGKDPAKVRYVEPAVPDVEGLPELPEGWCWATLDELSWHVTSGSRGWAQYYADSGSLFVRVGNFNRLGTKIDLQNVVFVKVANSPEADRSRLQIGDLLITITADVGMVGVVDERVLQWGEAFINQHVGLVRFIYPELAAFVALALASEPIQTQIRNKQYGATKMGLGLEDLRSLTVPLAPQHEQYDLMAEVEQQLSMINELEAAVEYNLKRAERLRQSIMLEAFAGRRVPQDPNDEPASVLLERIQEERAKREQEEKLARQNKEIVMTTPRGKQPKRTAANKQPLPLRQVLIEARQPITPDDLLRKAGLQADAIDDFYEELREEVRNGRIKELRRDTTEVLLEAVGEDVWVL